MKITVRRENGAWKLGRKAVLLLLVLLLALAAAACGEKAEQEEAVTGNDQTFRSALENMSEEVITLDEDIELTQPVRVNGVKRLTGAGKITMAEIADRMFTLEEGAELILDGVTINCAYRADTVFYVPEGASFTLRSGSILNAGRYGIDVRGKASVEGGEMSIAGNSWVNVEQRGTLDISGGSFRNAGDVGICVWKYASMTMSGGTLDTTGDVGIYNHGVLTMTGGKITGTRRSAVMNANQLTLDGPVELSSNTTKALLYNSGHGTAFVRGVYLHESASYGIYSEGGQMELEDVRIDGTVYSAIRNNKYGTIKAKNIDITASRSSGVSNYGTMEVENAKICTTAEYGVINRGNAVLKNVSVEDVHSSAFCHNATVSGGTEYGTLELYNVSVANSDSFGIISYGGELTVEGTTLQTGDCNLFVRGGSAVISNSALLGTDKKPCAYIGGEKYRDAVVTLNNVTMSGGSKGITNYATVIATDCVFEHNYNDKQGALGGGIYNVEGHFTMNGGRIGDNFIKGAGGAVYSSGTFIANGVYFENNRIAGNIGGGLFNKGTMMLSDCVVEGNVSELSGGGLYNRGDATVENCRISGNAAEGTYYGGGIYNTGELRVAGGTISENEASIGGALYNSGTAVISDAVLEKNVGKKYGGGVRNMGVLTLEGATVAGNVNAESYVDCDVYHSSTSGAEITAQLTLVGLCDIGGIYKNSYAEIWVEDGFAAKSPILLRLAEKADSSYWTAGTTVLLGSDAALEKAVAYFTLPADVVGLVLAADGTLRAVGDTEIIKESGTVELWRGGQKVDSGLFSVMLRAARDGDTLVVTEDIVASRYARVGRDITITDDGTLRTIRSTLTGSNLIAVQGSADEKTEVSIVGSESGGLIFTGKDETGKIVESSVPLLTANYGKINITGKVFFRDICCVGIKETDTVKNNTVNYGSAMRISGGSEAYLNGTVFENCCGVAGGAISSNGKLQLDNVVAENCTSTGHGGFAYLLKSSGTGETVMNDCRITNCTAVSGGAISMTSGNLVINGGEISGNTAKGNGGGVNAAGSATVTVNGGTVSGNTAKNGMDIYAVNPVTLRGALGIGEITLGSESAVVELPEAISLVDPNKRIALTKEAGNVLLNGAGTAASVDCFTYNDESGWYSIGEDGTLRRDPKAPSLGTVELKRGGTVVETGTPEEMLAAAQDGDTLVLRSDIYIERTLKIKKDVTITDDGTKRTISNTLAKAYAIDVSNTSDDKAIVKIVGTEKGGIALCGQDYEGKTVRRDRALLRVNQGVLNIEGNVVFRDIRNEGGTGTAVDYCGSAITVWRSGELNLVDTTFERCFSKLLGGAISASGTVTMDNVTTYKCSSDRNGGFLYAYGGTTKIVNSFINDNYVNGERYGGAIAVAGADVDIYRSAVEDNCSKEGGGGAFYITKGKLSIRDSLIANNTALLSGGAVYLSDGEVYIEGSNAETIDETLSCVFRENSSGENGGAVYIGKGECVVDGAIFNRNEAEAGGGIYVTRTRDTGLGGELTMNGGRLVGNVSRNGVGGALRVAKNAVGCLLHEVTITGNYAKSGSSTNYGGGIAVAGGDIVLNGCMVYGNYGSAVGKDISASSDVAVCGESKIGVFRVNGAQILTDAGDPVTLVAGAAPIEVQSYANSTNCNVVGTKILGGSGIAESLASFTYRISGYMIDGDGVLQFASSDPETDVEVEIVPGGGAGGGTGGSTVVGGSLAAILEQARDGDVIVLKKDAVLDRAVSVGYSITLKGETGSEKVSVTADGALTFSGEGKSSAMQNLTFDGGNNEKSRRLITVNGGAELVCSGITVSGVKTSGINGSVAYVSNGTLHLNGGTNITGNTGEGGSSYGTVSAYGVNSKIFADSITVSGNSHRYAAAFAAVRGSEITIVDTTITGNTATEFSGGAIYVGADNADDEKNAAITVTRGEISGNSTTVSGGALRQTGGTVTLNEVKLSANTAVESGGALYTSAGVLNVNGCTLGGATREEGNTAQISGGAIYLSGGTLSVDNYNGTNTVIENNFSLSSGAAIYSKGTLSAVDVLIRSNETTEGLGVLTLSGGSASFSGTEIAGNAATANVVGGVYVNAAAVTMTDCTVKENVSTNENCGDVYLRSSTGSLTLRGETAIGRLRVRDGGVITLDEAEPVTLGSAEKIVVWSDVIDVGTQILAGSGIAVSREAFASSEPGLGIDEEGRLFLDLSADNIVRLIRGGSEVKVGLFKTLLAEAQNGDTIEILSRIVVEDEVIFDKTLTISGAGKTILFKGAASQFEFAAGSNLTFEGTTAENLVISGEGFDTERTGAAFNSTAGAVTTLNDVTVEKFYRTDNVGTVFYLAGGSSLTVNGGGISGNRNKLNASVLRLDNGTMTIANGCVISYNETEASRGDAFYLNGNSAKLVLDGAEVTNNGSVNGMDTQGAIYLKKGTLEIAASTVKDNGNAANAGDVSLDSAYSGAVKLSGSSDIGYIKLSKDTQTLALAADFAASGTIELLGMSHGAGKTILTGDGVAANFDKFSYPLPGHYISRNGVVKGAPVSSGADPTLTRGGVVIATDNLDELLEIAEDGDVITLADELLLGGELTLDRAVVLTGSTIRFAADGAFAVNADVTFRNITLDAQSADRTKRLLTLGSGADVTMDTVSVKNVVNTASGENGAIAEIGAGTTLTAADSTFSGNVSAASGGALAIAGGAVTLENVIVSGNTAQSGAAICLAGGTMTLSGGSFEGNTGSSDIFAETSFAVDGAAVLGNVLLGENSVITLASGIDASATATVEKENAALGTQILTLAAGVEKPAGIVYNSTDGTRMLAADGTLQVKTYAVTLDAASPVTPDCSEPSQHGCDYEMSVSGASASDVYELSYWGADNTVHYAEFLGGKLTIPGDAVREDLTVSVRKLQFTVHTESEMKTNYESLDDALTAAAQIENAIVTVHADGTLAQAHTFTKNITVTGDGQKRTVRVTADGSGEGRITVATSDITFRLCGSDSAQLVFDGGNDVRSKRFLTLSKGTTQIENAVIEKFNYTAAGNGAAVAYVYGSAELEITDSVVRDNSSVGVTGAIWVQAGSAAFTNITVTGNTSQEGSGAVRVSDGGALAINGGSFSGNPAGTGKGDLFLAGTGVTLNGAVEFDYIRVATNGVLGTDTALEALTLKNEEKKIGVRYYVSATQCDTLGYVLLSENAGQYYDLFEYAVDGLSVNSQGVIMEDPSYGVTLEKKLKGVDGGADFAAAGDATVKANKDYTVTLTQKGYYTYEWKLVGGGTTLAESAAEGSVNVDGTTDSFTIESVPTHEAADAELIVTITRWTYGVETDGTQTFYGSFDDALDAVKTSGGTLTLYTDAQLGAEVTLSKEITIRTDGSERTITLTGTATRFKFGAGADVAFEGTAAKNLVIKGEGNSVKRTASAIYASGGAKVSFADVTLKDFYRDNNVGPVFYTSGSSTKISVSGGSITNNKSKVNGSVAWIDGGMLTVSGGCVISGNVASGSRAEVLYANSGSIVLDGVSIVGNSKSSGTGSEGAVYVKTGALTVRNTTIKDNASPTMDISLHADNTNTVTLGGTNDFTYIQLRNKAQTITLESDFALAADDGITVTTDAHAVGDTLLAGAGVAESCGKFTVNDGNSLVVGEDGKLESKPSLLSLMVETIGELIFPEKDETTVIEEKTDTDTAAESVSAAVSGETPTAESGPEDGETAKEPEEPVTGEETPAQEGVPENVQSVDDPEKVPDGTISAQDDVQTQQAAELA